MSALLDDIINLAVDGSQPLPDILRKCLLLGHELKNDQLKAWANSELNGYKTIEELPDYRVIPAQAKGNFTGPLHARANNHNIPPVILKPEHRHWATTAYLLQSVSAYAEVVKNGSSQSGVLMFEWPANMVVYYQQKIIPHLPVNAAVEMLDTVRNRTLNMALQIKDELGTSYSNLRTISSSEAAGKIQGIVFQNIGSTNVSFGQSRIDASGQSTNVNLIDRKALDALLVSAGLEKSDLDSLTEAINTDGNKPARNVGEWIKEKASKVLVGGVKIGTTIGTEVLTTWIKQHYGLTP